MQLFMAILDGIYKWIVNTAKKKNWNWNALERRGIGSVLRINFHPRLTLRKMQRRSGGRVLMQDHNEGFYMLIKIELFR